MQTLHILPALRNKLQDSDGTFNLRKERMKERKKKNSSVLLPAWLYRKIRKSALKILILHAGHVW